MTKRIETAVINWCLFRWCALFFGVVVGSSVVDGATVVGWVSSSKESSSVTVSVVGGEVTFTFVIIFCVDCAVSFDSSCNSSEYWGEVFSSSTGLAWI